MWGCRFRHTRTPDRIATTPLCPIATGVPFNEGLPAPRVAQPVVCKRGSRAFLYNPSLCVRGPALSYHPKPSSNFVLLLRHLVQQHEHTVVASLPTIPSFRPTIQLCLRFCHVTLHDNLLPLRRAGAGSTDFRFHRRLLNPTIFRPHPNADANPAHAAAIRENCYVSAGEPLPPHRSLGPQLRELDKRPRRYFDIPVGIVVG